MVLVSAEQDIAARMRAQGSGPVALWPAFLLFKLLTNCINLKVHFYLLKALTY